MRHILAKGSIGYCAVPDVRDPATLLRQTSLAKEAGFTMIWASDHFMPWSHTNAYECHTWTWMSTALERVKDIPFGTSVTAPVLRYHPALIAQAFATMQVIHGNRVILGLGTGEALNEMALGYSWPPLTERRARLVEAVKVMRKLWAGEFVTFEGKYFKLRNANLYMRANVPVFLAGFGPKMARLAGRLGDGLITLLQPTDYYKNVLFPAVEEGAKSKGRSPNEICKVVELDVTYDQDYDRALESVRFMAQTLLPEVFKNPIPDPRVLEAMGKKVSDKDLEEAFVISTSSEEHIRKIEEAFKVGFDHVYISSSAFDEEGLIRMYKKEVLPYFTQGKR